MSWKTQMLIALDDELYSEQTGYTTTINIYSDDAGGYSVIDIVLLDNAASDSTIAYRLSTQAQDDMWKIGNTEDAVNLAIEEHERIQELLQ